MGERILFYDIMRNFEQYFLVVSALVRSIHRWNQLLRLNIHISLSMILPRKPFSHP